MKRIITLLAVLSWLLAGSMGQAESYGVGYVRTDGTMCIDYMDYDYAFGFAEGLAMVFKGELSKNSGFPREGKYGFIDQTGKLVIDMEYDKASDFHEGLACVKAKGKYGYINAEGTVVIPFEWDQALDFYDGIARVFSGTCDEYGYPMDGTYSLIDTQGNVRCTLNWEAVRGIEENGLLAVKERGKWGFVDLNNVVVIEPQWDDVGGFADGIAEYQSGEKYGYLREDGTKLTECIYDFATRFVDGYALVEQNGVRAFLNTDGETGDPLLFDYISISFSGGVAHAFNGTLSEYGFPEEGVHYLIDMQGKPLTEGLQLGKRNVLIHGIWCVKMEDRGVAIDKTGEIIADFGALDPYAIISEDCYIVRDPVTELYGLAAGDGSILVEPKWVAYGKSDDGTIAVKCQPLENDFRTVRWGMSKEDVMAREGLEPDYTGNLSELDVTYIGYDTKLMGKDCLLGFYFCDKGLYEARYIMTETHTADSKYISDYKEIRAALTDKYGEPLRDQENWDTSRHKEYYSSDKARALNYGFLEYCTTYHNARTDIMMIMNAEDYKIGTIIYYNSTTISPDKADYSHQL